MTSVHELHIKKRLQRIVHVLLTHSWDRSVSKEEFCRRVAWSVEHVIDEIEYPRQYGQIRQVGEILKGLDEINKRIRRRIEGRTENDWEECPEFLAGRTR